MVWKYWHGVCALKKKLFQNNTCHTWHVNHGGRWTFSQHGMSLALTVGATQCFKDIFTNWVDQSVTKVFVEQPRLHRVFFFYSIHNFTINLFTRPHGALSNLVLFSPISVFLTSLKLKQFWINSSQLVNHGHSSCLLHPFTGASESCKFVHMYFPF